MTSPKAGTAEARLFDLLEELSMEIAELNADIEETREQVQQKALFLRAGALRCSARLVAIGRAGRATTKRTAVHANGPHRKSPGCYRGSLNHKGVFATRRG